MGANLPPRPRPPPTVCHASSLPGAAMHGPSLENKLKITALLWPQHIPAQLPNHHGSPEPQDTVPCLSMVFETCQVGRAGPPVMSPVPPSRPSPCPGHTLPPQGAPALSSHPEVLRAEPGRGLSPWTRPLFIPVLPWAPDPPAPGGRKQRPSQCGRVLSPGCSGCPGKLG